MAVELSQFRGATTCLVCGSPLSHLRRVGNERFCGERCRWKYATIPPHQICTVCGKPLSARQFGARTCASPGCLRRVEELKREREGRRIEALREKAGELRDREAAVLGVQGPETYTPTVLPSSRARVTNLPERRRRAFRNVVNRLISAASERLTAPSPPPVEAGRPSEPAAPTPEVLAVLGGACALCEGFCCGQGGNRAYLTVETIRRYQARHPELRPRDVLAAYLGRVGNKTYEGSCLFHQPGGCQLPREMRSDTCNRYFCTGLTEFQQGLTGGDPARGFFVATAGDAILAAAFCDANGSRPVAIPPAADVAVPTE